MNYTKMSYISGLVIFISIVIVLVSIITLAEKRIFFTKDYVIYVKFTDVIGLKDQSPVFMRGYRIGYVKQVEFEQDYVKVRVDINKKYTIPRDSKFELNTISLLGEKAITIIPGPSPEPLKAHDVTMGENKDIMNEMKKILADVRTNMDQGEMNVRLRQLSESVNYLHAILGKLNTQVAKLDVDKYNAQIRSLGDAGAGVTHFVQQNADSVTSALGKLSRAADELALFSKQASRLTSRLNEGEGSAGELLTKKEYIQNLNEAITEIRMLVDDLQKNPKKYINVSVF